jgi:hypothetical protein
MTQQLISQYNAINIIIIMIKEKAKEHGSEYVLLNDDENQLWEIDYNTLHAVNVSEFVKLDSVKRNNIVKYSGTIEDFLLKERDCKNIHFHETTGLPARLHMKSCSFETHD